MKNTIKAVTLGEAQARTRAIIQLAKQFPGFKVSDAVLQQIGAASDAVLDEKEREAVRLLLGVETTLVAVLRAFFRNSIPKRFNPKIADIQRLGEPVGLEVAALLAHLSKMEEAARKQDLNLEEAALLYARMGDMIQEADRCYKALMAERCARIEEERRQKREAQVERQREAEAAREAHRQASRTQAKQERAAGIRGLMELAIA